MNLFIIRSNANSFQLSCKFLIETHIKAISEIVFKTSCCLFNVKELTIFIVIFH